MTTTIILVADGVILVLLATSITTIRRRMRLRKKEKRTINLDMEIFKNEEFIKSQQDCVLREIPHSDTDLKVARKDRLDYFDSYSTGYGIIKERVREHVVSGNQRKSMREDLAITKEDLAIKTATPFKHGGMNMSNSSTNYFNI